MLERVLASMAVHWQSAGQRSQYTTRVKCSVVVCERLAEETSCGPISFRRRELGDDFSSSVKKSQLRTCSKQSMKVVELLAEPMRGEEFVCGLDERIGASRGVDERCRSGDRIGGRWDSGTGRWMAHLS